MENIFSKEVSAKIIQRINNLNTESPAEWGKMNVAQMLAHCNVTYEMAYDGNHPPAKGFKKFLLKAFIKPMVCNEKRYPKNSRTAPQFLVVDEKEFETEKQRLMAYLNKTVELGSAHFEGKESVSFGALSSKEWNNMFYKHMDHHLTQFNV